MVMNATKISQKMKNKSLLRIEKMLKNEKKCYIMIDWEVRYWTGK